MLWKCFGTAFAAVWETSRIRFVSDYRGSGLNQGDRKRQRGQSLAQSQGASLKATFAIMPYQHLTDLPDSVRDHLPPHAQQIYREAFNHAWQEYADPQQRRDDVSREETAHKVAWAAVKRSYRKDAASGRWLPKP